MSNATENILANAWAEMSEAMRDRSPEKFIDVQRKYAKQIDALYQSQLAEKDDEIHKLKIRNKYLTTKTRNLTALTKWQHQFIKEQP